MRANVPSLFGRPFQQCAARFLSLCFRENDRCSNRVYSTVTAPSGPTRATPTESEASTTSRAPPPLSSGRSLYVISALLLSSTSLSAFLRPNSFIEEPRGAALQFRDCVRLRCLYRKAFSLIEYLDNDDGEDETPFGEVSVWDLIDKTERESQNGENMNAPAFENKRSVNASFYSLLIHS